MKRIFAVLLLLASAGAAIAAGNTNNLNMSVNTDQVTVPWYAGTPYIELQIGMGRIMDADISTYWNNLLGSGAQFEQSIGGLGWRVSGGYLMGREHWNYGLELGYNGYQSNTYSETGGTGYSAYSISAKISGYLFDLLAVGRYNFNDHWNVFLKFGPALVIQTAQVSENDLLNINRSETLTSVLPELGGGFAYQLNSRIAFTLEARYAFGTSDNAIQEAVAAQKSVPLSVLNVLFGVQISL